MVGKPGQLEAGSQGKASEECPSQCGTRGRAEDAREAVKEMASLMKRMNPEVITRLVEARNAAANVYKAFPEGDQRFDSFDSDDDDDDAESDAEADLEVTGELGEASSDYQEDCCEGLFDSKTDRGPHACLCRAKEDYGFDAVTEMDAASLDFFERIRVINFIRRAIKDGETAENTIRRVRRVLTDGDDAVLKDDALLTPIIEGDLLLTVLESEGDQKVPNDNEAEDIRDAVEDSLRTEHILS